MTGIRCRRVLFVPAGIIAGFLILHPYVMLVQRLIGPEASESGKYGLNGYLQQFFDPVMLPMGIAFAFFGGVVSLLVSRGIDRERKLLVSKHEREKGEIALRTLHNLMVTLSHYLLNANMIIGGKVRHCRKCAVDEDAIESLAVIEEQGRRIDAVLKVLRGAVEINTSGYTSNGLVAMIDISRELEDQLRASDTLSLNSRSPGGK